MQHVKRIAGLWPYVLVAISLTGLAYQFWIGQP
jgi:hypothetical protein